jgi:hypothetical protein
MIWRKVKKVGRDIKERLKNSYNYLQCFTSVQVCLVANDSGLKANRLARQTAGTLTFSSERTLERVWVRRASLSSVVSWFLNISLQPDSKLATSQLIHLLELVVLDLEDVSHGEALGAASD